MEINRRIYQVVITLAYGDGVGNAILAIDTILKGEGYITKVICLKY